MHKGFRWLILLFFVFVLSAAYGQQKDVDFHLSAHLLPGEKIIKVKRDFNDNYLWALTAGNKIYRVNSTTLSVDDYSAKFAAYSNVPFVDIIGRSADTLFVATGAKLIEYAKGNIRVFTAANNIPGAINSLGIDLGWNINSFGSRGEILIGTNKGLRTFNVKTQNIRVLPDGDWAGNSSKANTKIYESTYRAETYKDSINTFLSGWDSDTLHYLPFVTNNASIYYSGSFDGGYVWYGNKTFGYKVNTVHGLNDESSVNSNGFFASCLWGTENGMFQTIINYSNRAEIDPWSRYLNNIKINKITDIIGLTSFSHSYSSSLIKKNLLIGTDKGLYYSSSTYDAGGFYAIKFALFHYDELGNTVINDICVNAVPSADPICENGVWLGANDGLYLLKPDYGKYLSDQKQKFISFQDQPDDLSVLKICESTNVTATAQGDYTNIQWYKDGAELPGKNKATLAINAAGDYNAVIYDPCEGLHIESNHLKAEVISGPVFTFDYPSKLQFCDVASTTLNVTYSPAYHYRWYKNGVLTGEETSSLTVTESGKYKVEVSACTNSWVPSNTVRVDMVNLPQPVISSSKSIYCQSETATLSINTSADAAYSINWYRDNVLLDGFKNKLSINANDAGIYTVKIKSNISDCEKPSAGFPLKFITGPEFTFNYPDRLQYCAGTPVTLKVLGDASYRYRWHQDGALTNVTSASLAVTASGKYYAEVSSCEGSWVPTKEVNVTFVQVPAPGIITDKPAYCIGDNATLSVKDDPGSDYTINWYKDDVLLPGNTNKTFIITNVPGNYTVKFDISTPNTDGSACAQTSAPQDIVFNPEPTISIEKIINTTLCAGQSIRLVARYNEGLVHWSTGDTGDQIMVTAPGTYSVTVTSTAGCQATANIDITFLSNPALAVNDTSICTYKKEVVVLNAPSGFSKYEWNGVTGGQTLQVDKPQTVTLSVTDANGCQATQKIKVADRCPDIYIPNTFTPNSDGINDTWIIEGLDNDPTSDVRVFTRYGVLIFEDKGHSTTWNGEYRGKKLPAGVYYYIVTAKNDTQKFSGSLTIIY